MNICLRKKYQGKIIKIVLSKRLHDKASSNTGILHFILRRHKIDLTAQSITRRSSTFEQVTETEH
jgi:hypothetical protein